MSLLDILIFVAATTFLVGWLVVILDAISGFRLIGCIPSKILAIFGAVHNGAFIALATILAAGLLWNLAVA